MTKIKEEKPKWPRKGSGRKSSIDVEILKKEQSERLPNNPKGFIDSVIDRFIKR